MKSLLSTGIDNLPQAGAIHLFLRIKNIAVLFKDYCNPELYLHPPLNDRYFARYTEKQLHCTARRQRDAKRHRYLNPCYPPVYYEEIIATVLFVTR